MTMYSRRMSLDERISEIFGTTEEVEEEAGLDAALVDRHSHRRRSSAAAAAIMDAVEVEGIRGARTAIRNSLRSSARRDSLDAAIAEYIDQEAQDQHYRRRSSLDEQIAEIFDVHPDCEPPAAPEGAIQKEAWRSHGHSLAQPVSLDLQMDETDLWERARSVLVLCWWRQQAEARRLAAIAAWRESLPVAEQQRLQKLYEMGALRSTDPLARQMRYVKCATTARSATTAEAIPRVETIPAQKGTTTERLTAAAAKARPRRSERRLNSIETAALLALHEQKLLANKAGLPSTARPGSQSSSTRKGALTQPAMRQRSGRP